MAADANRLRAQLRVVDRDVAAIRPSDAGVSADIKSAPIVNGTGVNTGGAGLIGRSAAKAGATEAPIKAAAPTRLLKTMFSTCLGWKIAEAVYRGAASAPTRHSSFRDFDTALFSHTVEDNADRMNNLLVRMLFAMDDC